MKALKTKVILKYLLIFLGVTDSETWKVLTFWNTGASVFSEADGTEVVCQQRIGRCSYTFKLFGYKLVGYLTLRLFIAQRSQNLQMFRIFAILNGVNNFLELTLPYKVATCDAIFNSQGVRAVTFYGRQRAGNPLQRQPRRGRFRWRRIQRHQQWRDKFHWVSVN